MSPAQSPSLPSTPPARIQWHKQSNCLELDYREAAGGHRLRSFELTAEFLRVHSPSADVRGHGEQGGELPCGKAQVRISAVHPAGNYALQIAFDDGHDSGIYTWPYLFRLCVEQEHLWHHYLEQLHDQQKSRFAGEQVIHVL